MENWLKEHEAILYGIGFILLGVMGLLFMKYYGDTKEVRSREYKPSISQSIRFNIYAMSILCILGGIFVLLRALIGKS